MKVIHVGLPRTATTSLQKNFFPNLHNVIYLGKSYSNSKIKNVAVDNVQAILKGDRYKELPTIFSTAMTGYHDAMIKRNFARISQFLDFLKIAVNLIEVHATNVNKSVLWSDESFIESLSGLNGLVKNYPANWDSLPLITFKQYGIIGPQDEIVLTFRAPVDWIVSSYHRTCRLFFDEGKLELLQSIEDYISSQLALYHHTPVASRLFWCYQARALNFLKNMHSNTRAVDFNELVSSDKPYKFIVPSSELEDDASTKFLIENQGVSSKLDIEICRINRLNVGIGLYKQLKELLHMNHSGMIKEINNNVLYANHKS